MAVYAANTARSEKMWIQPTAGSSAHPAPQSHRGGKSDVSNSFEKNASMAISAISAAGRGSPANRDRRGAIGTRPPGSAAYRHPACRRESAAARHAIGQDVLVRAQKFYPSVLPQAIAKGVNRRSQGR